MAVSASITSSINLIHTSATGLATYTGNVSKSYTASLTSAQITKAYHATRIVSGTETLILTGGILSDAFNNSLSFSSVKGLLIHNKGAGNLVVGGGSNPFMAAVPLISGGCLSLMSTATLVAAGNSTVLVSGGSTYDVVIVGS